MTKTLLLLSEFRTYNNNNNNNNNLEKNVIPERMYGTHMEFLEFVVCMAVIFCIFILLWMKMASGNALKMQELAEKQRLADIRRKAANTRYQGNSSQEVGAWVSELASMAGFDVEQLFQDEMPEQIQKLVPIAKGFIESGGLATLLGNQQQPGGPGEQQPPTGGFI